MIKISIHFSITTFIPSPRLYRKPEYIIMSLSCYLYCCTKCCLTCPLVSFCMLCFIWRLMKSCTLSAQLKSMSATGCSTTSRSDLMSATGCTTTSSSDHCYRSGGSPCNNVTVPLDVTTYHLLPLSCFLHHVFALVLLLLYLCLIIR